MLNSLLGSWSRPKSTDCSKTRHCARCGSHSDEADYLSAVTSGWTNDTVYKVITELFTQLNSRRNDQHVEEAVDAIRSRESHAAAQEQRRKRRCEDKTRLLDIGKELEDLLEPLLGLQAVVDAER